MSLIDCLSSPLTIGAMCKKLGVTNLKLDKLILVCIGCSGKAEERILKETNCWPELQYCFPLSIKHIEVWFVGPEMTRSQSPSCTDKASERISFHLYKGTVIDFVRQHPNSISTNLVDQTSIFVGLNCGFGNWDPAVDVLNRFNLLMSWLNDLYFLTGTKIPLLFTCANDYADVVGETLVMSKILGAKYILIPCENRFSYASTLVQNLPKDNTKQSAVEATADNYSRGNSFIYAVQSHDPRRRQKLNLKDKNEFLVGILKTVTATKSNDYNEYYQAVSFDHIARASNVNNIIHKIAKKDVALPVTGSLADASSVANKSNTKATGVAPVLATVPFVDNTSNATEGDQMQLKEQSAVSDTTQQKSMEAVPEPPSSFHVIEQIKVSDEVLKITLRLMLEQEHDEKGQNDKLSLLRNIEFYIDPTGASLQVSLPDNVSNNRDNCSCINTTLFSHPLKYIVNPKTIQGKLKKRTFSIEILAEIM